MKKQRLSDLINRLVSEQQPGSMEDPTYRERFYDRSRLIYGDQRIAQLSNDELLLPVVDEAELPPVPTEELWHKGFAED